MHGPDSNTNIPGHYCACVYVCAYELQHFPVIKVVSTYRGVPPVFQKQMSFWWIIWVAIGKHITYDTVMDYKLTVLFCMKNSKWWFMNPVGFVWQKYCRSLLAKVLHSGICGGTQKFSELLKKSLFKVFIQVWNFIPLQSTPPATGCNNPSTAPNAGNNV